MSENEEDILEFHEKLLEKFGSETGPFKYFDLSFKEFFTKNPEVLKIISAEIQSKLNKDVRKDVFKMVETDLKLGEKLRKAQTMIQSSEDSCDLLPTNPAEKMAAYHGKQLHETVAELEGELSDIQQEQKKKEADIEHERGIINKKIQEIQELLSQYQPNEDNNITSLIQNIL